MTEPQWQNPNDPTAPPAWPPPPWSAQAPADPYAGPPTYPAPVPYSAPPTYSAPPAPAAPGYGTTPYPPLYGGYPAPYQPPPPRSGGKIALVIVLAVVVVAGLCTGGVLLLSGNDPKPKAGAGATTPTTASSANAPTNTEPGPALYDRIVEPPTGSHEYDLDKGVDGVFTVSQLVDQAFDDDTANGRLTKAGFVVAAGRDYARPDGLEIVVYLLQFTKPAGATSTYNYVTSGRDDDKTVTGSFEVGGGKGYDWDTLDKLGNRRSEMYKVVGNVLILLNVYTPGEIDITTNLKQLSDQVDALS
jgi:hypothetical protein